MALVYPISQFYLCTELKILFLWTLLIVFVPMKMLYKLGVSIFH